MAPQTAPILETPRLRLIRISDTSFDSEHLKWFHTTWSDPVATQWSLHGTCTTLSASQSHFKTHLEKYDSILYIVFAKHSAEGEELPFPGEVLGNVALRTKPEGPDLPPPPPSSSSNHTADRPLNLRSLGYSYLPTAWGKGYATEAARAVIDAYRETARAKGEGDWYIEAIWGPANAASGKVLGKLGFTEIGFKSADRVWLAGEWRDGYVVSGLWV